MHEKDLSVIGSPSPEPLKIPGQRSSDNDSTSEPTFNFVLVHGAWHSKESWGPLRSELENLGHDTIAPNLPIDNPNASFEDDVKVVTEAMDGLDDIVLVGHSRGGEIIPRVLANFTLSKIIGAVTINSGGPHKFNLSKISIELSAKRYTEDFYKGIVKSESGMSTYDKIHAAEVFYHDVKDKTLLNLALQSLRSQRDVAREAGTIPDFPPEIPVYSLLSTEDRVHNSERARLVTAKWLNSKIIDFPGGHTPQLSHPVELANLLVSLAVESKATRLI